MAGTDSISKLCRMCLAPVSGGFSLWQLLDDEEENAPSITEAVHKVLGCKLVQDGDYPTTICSACKMNLLNAFYLQRVVVRSQKMLDDVFEDIKDDVQGKILSSKSPVLSPMKKISKLQTFLLGEGPALPQASDSSNKLLQEAVDLNNSATDNESHNDFVEAKGVVAEEADEGDVVVDIYDRVYDDVQESSYWCHICELVLIGESVLDEHIAEHERVNIEMQATEMPSAEETVTESNVVVASSKSSEKFTCDICDKRFASKDTYRKHLKSHGVQHLKKCDQCDKAFHKTSLEQHKKNAHQNGSPTPIMVQL